MTRVTVTAGSGDGRAGAACRKCFGYGDIRKFHGAWMCFSCRLNTSTVAEADKILTEPLHPEQARQVQQRRTQALIEIQDRRTFNTTGTLADRTAVEDARHLTSERGFFSRRKKTLQAGAPQVK